MIRYEKAYEKTILDILLTIIEKEDFKEGKRIITETVDFDDKTFAIVAQGYKKINLAWIGDANGEFYIEVCNWEGKIIKVMDLFAGAIKTEMES